MSITEEKEVFLIDLDTTLYSEPLANEVGLKAAYKTYSAYAEHSEEEFKELYYEKKDEFLRELAGSASSHNRILRFQRMVEEALGQTDTEKTLQLYNVYWEAYIEAIVPFEGVMETLSTLREMNKKIAIVTNLTAHIQLRKIEKLNVNNMIDVLMTSEEAGVEKPHPAIYLMTLDKIRYYDKSKVVMIGDGLSSDIEGANAAGIDSVWFRQPEQIDKDIPRSQIPTHTIDLFNELLLL